MVSIWNYFINLKINYSKMIIERTDKEIIIRIPSYVTTDGLQNLVDYLTYKEATSKSKASQNDVDLLSKEVKKGWWKENKSRLIK